MKTLFLGAGVAAIGWIAAAFILPGTASATVHLLVATLAIAALTAALLIIGCLVIIAGEARRIRQRRAVQPAPGIRAVIEGGRK